jgi:uncharacterized membrane protein
MNNPNQTNPQDNPRTTSERTAPPVTPSSTAEAGSKLKEAQAKLLEAEAKLGASDPSATRAKTERTKEDAPEPSVRNTTPQRVESAVRSAPAEAKVHAPSKPVTEYLSENVAAMLCYLLGWISGLVFLFFDRRPFVRFHAAQSVAVFATLNILILALGGFLLGALIPAAAGALFFLRHLLELAWIVIAVVLMLKAAGGERARVKIASHYGDGAAHGGK